MTKDASRKVKEPASGRMQTGQEMALTSIVSSGVHYELVSSEVSLDYTVHTKCPGGRKRAHCVRASRCVGPTHTRTTATPINCGKVLKLGATTHTHTVYAVKKPQRDNGCVCHTRPSMNNPQPSPAAALSLVSERRVQFTD